MTVDWADEEVRFPRYVRWKGQEARRVQRAYPRLKALRLVVRELKGLQVREPLPVTDLDDLVPSVHQFSKYRPISRTHLINTFSAAWQRRGSIFFSVGDLFYDRQSKQLLTIVGVQRGGVHIELPNDSEKRYLTYNTFTPPRFIMVEMIDTASTRTTLYGEMARRMLHSRRAATMTHVRSRTGKGIGKVSLGARRYKPVNTRNNRNAKP